MKDLCITCGKEVDEKLWGGECEAGHESVHQLPCGKCGRLCGVITDDDYCGPEKLICPDCMDKIRNQPK